MGSVMTARWYRWTIPGDSAHGRSRTAALSSSAAEDDGEPGAAAENVVPTTERKDQKIVYHCVPANICIYIYKYKSVYMYKYTCRIFICIHLYTFTYIQFKLEMNIFVFNTLTFIHSWTCHVKKLYLSLPFAENSEMLHPWLNSSSSSGFETCATIL